MLRLSRTVYLALTLLMPPMLFACATTGNTAMLSFTAEVSANGADSSLYVLIDEEGTRYEPVNLPLTYRTAGTILKVTASEITERATTSQAGKLIELHDITLVSKGEGKNSSATH